MRIREVRHQRGLSQEALAHELDCHRTYIGSIERGKRNVSLRVLEDLAARLDVAPQDLLRPFE